MDPTPPPSDTITEDHLESPPQTGGGNEGGGGEKQSKSLEKLRGKVLGLAPLSRLPPDHQLRIQDGFKHLFPNLTVPNHPPYASMIHRAITELNKVGGSSMEDVSNFIKEKYNSLPWAHATLLRSHLKKLCENGEVVVTDENCYMLRNGSLTSDPNRSFTLSEIPTPVSSYSPSPSSNSTSDYSPRAKRRQQKRRTRSGKYRKKHGRARRKSDYYEEESEKTEETTEEPYSEEELEDTDDETGESFQNTEEVEVTEIESEEIEAHEQVNGTRGKAAKMYKTDKTYISGEKHIRAGLQHQRQLLEAYDRGTKPMRGRGRRPKSFRVQTSVGLKEAQGAIETHSPVTKDCKRPKQKRRRGRPPNSIGSETNIGQVETHKQVPEQHFQVKGDQKMPTRRRGSSQTPENIGTETNTGDKEVHKVPVEAFNQIKDDLMRSKKKGRGRLPKNTGVETNIGEGAGRPKQKRGRGRPRNLSWMETDLEHKEAREELIGPNNQVIVGQGKPLQQDMVPRQFEFKGLQSGEQIEASGVHNQIIEDGKKLKQGGRRCRPRKHYNTKEDIKQKDLLEVIVVQDKMERMTIRSCDDDERNDKNSLTEVFPGLTRKSHELLMEGKIRKDKEQQEKSAHGEIDLFDTYYWAQHPEKSDESKDMAHMGKLSLTTVQLPQQGAEYDQLYSSQSHFQPLGPETDAYRAMEEMTPLEILWHADHQPKYIDQGVRPKFEQVTTVASLTLPNYQAEDGWKRKQVKIGVERVPETNEETAVSTQLVLHPEYQCIPHHQPDQPKHQRSDGCDSHEPTHCSGEGLKACSAMINQDTSI